MKRTLLLLTVFPGLLSFAGAVTQTDNCWQAVNGSWAGSWDDANHWSLGAIGEGQKGRFDLKNNQPIEVTYPAGAYANAGEIFLRGWDARWSIRLNGTNTTYMMAGNAEGTEIHSTRPFGLNMGNGGLASFNFLGPYSDSPFTFTNFDIRFDSTDDELLLDFDGGTYAFSQTQMLLFSGHHSNLSDNRRIRFRDAAITGVTWLHLMVTKPLGHAGRNLVELDNTKLTVSGSFAFPLGSDGCENPYEEETTEFRVDNGSVFTFNGVSMAGNYNQGILSNKTFVITVDHGSAMTNLNGSAADMGTGSGHYVFNVLNGAQVEFGNRSIYFGQTGYGVTDVNVSNAVWKTRGSNYFGPRNSGSDSTSDYVDTMCGNLNLTEATVSNLTGTILFTSGGLGMIDSALVGDPILLQNVDRATARFHANGALFRFLQNNVGASDLWRDWDEATIGARGFTIDNRYTAATLSQDFADAEDESGVLTLTGTKAFTVNATNMTVSTVAVSGVTATFAETAKLVSALVVTNGGTLVNVPTNGLKKLVVGDAETTCGLKINYANTVVVAGELVLTNAALTSLNRPTKDVTNVLFRAQSASAATRRFWKRAALDISPDTGCGFLFETVDTAQGVEFRLTMLEGLVYEENLTTATQEERSDAIAVASVDTVKSTVAEGGELTLSGEIGDGRFEKWGEGKVVLTNPNNLFIGGVGLYEGILGVTAAGALGYADNGVETTLAGGVLELALADSSTAIRNPLRLATPVKTDPVVLKVENDATIPVWNTATDKGVMMKTGGGTLTVKATADAQITGNAGLIPNVRDSAFSSTNPLVFEEDGRYKSGLYLGFSVTEGEVRFEGPKSVTIASPYAIGIGAPVTGTSGKTAGVVVDGLTLDHRNQWGVDRLPICSGLNPGVNCDETLLDPYLTVTNGGTLFADNIQFGSGVVAAEGGCYWLRPHFDVVDGSAATVGILYMNGSETSNLVPRVNVRGGSSLYVPGSGGSYLELAHSAVLTVEDSVLAANANLEPVTVKIGNGWNTTEATLAFENGSTFCGRILSGLSASYTHQGKMRLCFDDSAWDPVSTDYVFEPSNTAFKVEVSGRGVILAPPENGTWTWLYETTGTGGLAKEGLGRLVLNATNATYTGTTVVNAGTLDLDGSAWTNRTFGGTGGTLANGTLERCTVSNTNLTYAATLQICGRHWIDLGGEGQAHETRIVGRYEGAAPDLSKWRVTNAADPILRATFSACEGVIRADLRNPGLIFLVQ